MNMKMRKLISWASAVALLATMLTVFALPAAADSVTVGGTTYTYTNAYAFTPNSYAATSGWWATVEMTGVPGTKTGYLYYDITIDVDPSVATNGSRGIVLTIDGTNVSGMIHDQHPDTTGTGDSGATMRVHPSDGLTGTFKGVLDVSAVAGNGIFMVQGTRSTLTINEMKYLDGVTTGGGGEDPDPGDDPTPADALNGATVADVVDGQLAIPTFKWGMFASNVALTGESQSAAIVRNDITREHLLSTYHNNSLYFRYDFEIKGLQSGSADNFTVEHTVGFEDWGSTGQPFENMYDGSYQYTQYLTQVSFTDAILAAEGLTEWKDGHYTGAITFDDVFACITDANGYMTVKSLSGRERNKLWYDNDTYFEGSAPARINVPTGATLDINYMEAVTYNFTTLSAVAAPEFDILGASVRGDDEMRFGIQVDSKVEGVQYGTMILPADLRTGHWTENQRSLALVIPTENWQDEMVATQGLSGALYTAVLTGVPSVSYERPISACGYAVYTVGGQKYVVYTGTISRSISGVYAAAQA